MFLMETYKVQISSLSTIKLSKKIKINNNKDDEEEERKQDYIMSELPPMSEDLMYDWLKMYVDAVAGNWEAFMAAISRNDVSRVIEVWSSKVATSNPQK